jgi:leader peptidase (prepilin peptidase)/N-methyltransferase
MEKLNYILCFLVGTVFGSFYNVVIYRLPEGMSIVKPPSSCPSCDERILPQDNIPVLSFFLLKGKCRSCGTKIPIRYPLVELCGGLIFFLSYLFDGMSFMFLRDALFCSILLIVTFIDVDKRIIPDILSLGGLVV